MGACPYGAEPTPGAEETQVWIDRAELALSVANIIKDYAPLTWASIAMSLTSVEGICAENPDPPEPITVADLIGQTTAFPAPSGLLNQAVVVKAYQWLRYQQFLFYCQCKLPPTTPGANCTHAPASFPIGSLDQVAGPFPVQLDAAVRDSWITHANGDFDMYFTGRAQVDGGAHTGNELLIEYQNDLGAWVVAGDIETLNLRHSFCGPEFMAAVARKPGLNTGWRIRNRAGGAHTITNFEICFCAVSSSPPPLPVQPPLTGTPLPPAHSCSTEDLCAITNELAHRLTVIGAQISDIQAMIGGRDQLRVINETLISGEGEIELVPGTRAVSVELTALGPEAYTSALGRPRGLMRVGSIRWADGTGYSPRTFIDADHFTDEPPVGAIAVSYQLLAGTAGVLQQLG